MIEYLPRVDDKSVEGCESLVIPMVNPIVESLPSNDWLRQKKGRNSRAIVDR